jgi:L-ribulose-5-phosphate 3-epimerase
MKRREALVHLPVVAASLLGGTTLWGQPTKKKYHLGACDWSLHRACNPEVFAFAKQMGLEGVQLSYNSRKDETYLLRPDNQEAMRAASVQTGVKIASLAIGELNRVPLKSEARTVDWVSGSIDAAHALGVQVVLLAFFSQGDLRKDDEGKKVVIERLRQVVPKAEKQGVILAIESYLSAKEHLEIIEAVGSPNVRVYYDPRNAADAGHDPYAEILMLGKRKLISEIHLKENEFLLGQGSIDWKHVKVLLDEIEYKGWAQIEGAVPKGKTVEEAYPQNVKFVREIFG